MIVTELEEDERMVRLSKAFRGRSVAIWIVGVGRIQL